MGLVVPGLVGCTYFRLFQIDLEICPSPWPARLTAASGCPYI